MTKNKFNLPSNEMTSPIVDPLARRRAYLDLISKQIIDCPSHVVVAEKCLSQADYDVFAHLQENYPEPFEELLMWLTRYWPHHNLPILWLEELQLLFPTDLSSALCTSFSRHENDDEYLIGWKDPAAKSELQSW